MRTIEILRQRFPKMVVPARDDLCYATKNRQEAVRKIASEVDMFLVVTSSYSSNGMRLLELADTLTGNSRRVESVAEIVGRRLRELGDERQVLCVTHLAQVASCGQWQIRVDKSVQADTVSIETRLLDADQRVKGLPAQEHHHGHGEGVQIAAWLRSTGELLGVGAVTARDLALPRPLLALVLRFRRDRGSKPRLQYGGQRRSPRDGSANVARRRSGA